MTDRFAGKYLASPTDTAGTAEGFPTAAFDWNTFDLGYPSAIAVLWFVIILVFVVVMTRLLRQRDKLEF